MLILARLDRVLRQLVPEALLCALQISGMLKVNNDTSFTVTNFNYDGQARHNCVSLLGCTCASGQIAHGGRVLCSCHPCALAYRVQTFDSVSYAVVQAPAVHWWATKGLTRSALRCAPANQG